LQGITIALNEAAHISLPKKSAGTELDAQALKESPRVHGMVKMGQVGPGAPRPRSLPFGGPSKKKHAAIRSGINGIYPVETSIVLPETVIFMWNPPVNFRMPMVIAEGEGIPQTTIAITTPKKTAAQAAAKELGLKEGGSYSWYLASRGDKKGRGRSRRFPFRILSKDRREQLAHDLARIGKTAETPDGRAFLKGQLYFNYGMNYEMVQTLLPLWKKNR
jgi:hypothetical protein